MRTKVLKRKKELQDLLDDIDGDLQDLITEEEIAHTKVMVYKMAKEYLELLLREVPNPSKRKDDD
jgi:hypothetical protein